MALGFRPTLLAATALLAFCTTPATAQTADGGKRLYELRTYGAAPRRVEDVEGEFQSWIIPGQARAGVRPVAYWSNEGDKAGVTYLMVFKDQAERDAACARFRADPQVEKDRVAATAK